MLSTRVSRFTGMPGFTSVRTKILAALLLASIVAGGVGLVSVWQTAKVAHEGQLIYAEALVPNQQLSALREAVVQARFDVVSRSSAKSPDAYAMADKDLKADEIKITQISADYAKTSLNQQQRTLLAGFNQAWNAYKVVRDEKMTPALLSGDLVRYEKVRTTELIPLVNAILGSLNQLSDQADMRARAALASAEQAQRTARLIVLLLLAVGLVLAVVLGAIIANLIMRPVRLVRDVLDAVANNDLSRTAEVNSRDELGQMSSALNTSIAHLRVLHETLNRQALHDPLTGLPNRAALTGILERTLLTGPSRCAVLFIDLDGFKQVNDRLGHAAGDQLLINVAERIAGSVRSDDLVARLGGDEFVVVCGDAPDEQVVTELARRVIERLTTPFRIGNAEAVVSASVGIAISDAHSTSTTLLHQADLAMYRAKVAGKARSVIFDRSLDDTTSAHADVLVRLTRAS